MVQNCNSFLKNYLNFILYFCFGMIFRVSCLIAVKPLEKTIIKIGISERGVQRAHSYLHGGGIADLADNDMLYKRYSYC